MTKEEFKNRIVNDERFALEVLLESNPETHMSLMQKYGADVSISIESMLQGFDILRNNESYLREFINVPLLKEKLNNVHVEVLDEMKYLEGYSIKNYPYPKPHVKKASSFSRGKLPPKEEDLPSDAPTQKEGNGWMYAGDLIGGILNGFFGKKQPPKQEQEKTIAKKDNTMWYVLGGIAFLTILIILLTRGK